jgi:hypothetical protein
MFDPVRHWSETISSNWMLLVSRLSQAESALSSADFALVLKNVALDGRTARSILRKYRGYEAIVEPEPENIFDDGPLLEHLEEMSANSTSPASLSSTLLPSAAKNGASLSFNIAQLRALSGLSTDELRFAAGLTVEDIQLWLGSRQDVSVAPPAKPERPSLSPELFGGVSVSSGSQGRTAFQQLINEITGSEA